MIKQNNITANTLDLPNKDNIKTLALLTNPKPNIILIAHPHLPWGNIGLIYKQIKLKLNNNLNIWVNYEN